MPHSFQPSAFRARKPKHRGVSFLRVRKSRLTFGAMTFAAAMLAMPALPASADVVNSEAVAAPAQTLEVSTDIAGLPIAERPSYGISQFSLIYWPIPAYTDISDGFGYRVPPCWGCSSFHDGIDFLPGAGSPIVSVADGVVIDASSSSSGGLGVYVTIQHSIDGQTVTTTYAHMASGSMRLAVGQKVSGGQFLGDVGNTGQSTGPHLHLEISVNGSMIDGAQWLRAKVNT